MDALPFGRDREMTEGPRIANPTIAVAESCTGGMLMTRFVETPGSGDWFLGGVVAYQAEIKFLLLDVPEGPVITEQAAQAMAAGVRRLLRSDIGIATTGVAGPDIEEGVPVGTVFIGVSESNSEKVIRLELDGDPDQVRRAASEHAYRYAVGGLPQVEEASTDAGQPASNIAVKS